MRVGYLCIVEEGLGVAQGEPDCVHVHEPLSLGVVDPLALRVSDTGRDPLGVADALGLPLGVWLRVRLQVSAADGEPESVPVGLLERVALREQLALGEGVWVGEGERVRVGLEDREEVGVGLAVRVCWREDVGLWLAVCGGRWGLMIVHPENTYKSRSRKVSTPPPFPLSTRVKRANTFCFPVL